MSRTASWIADGNLCIRVPQAQEHEEERDEEEGNDGGREGRLGFKTSGMFEPIGSGLPSVFTEYHFPGFYKIARRTIERNLATRCGHLPVCICKRNSACAGILVRQ